MNAFNTQDAFSFLVMCVRLDGEERVYQRYGSLKEAEAVAAALKRVGCPARVAEQGEADRLLSEMRQ